MSDINPENLRARSARGAFRVLCGSIQDVPQAGRTEAKFHDLIIAGIQPSFREASSEEDEEDIGLHDRPASSCRTRCPRKGNGLPTTSVDSGCMVAGGRPLTFMRERFPRRQGS